MKLRTIAILAATAAPLLYTNTMAVAQDAAEQDTAKYTTGDVSHWMNTILNASSFARSVEHGVAQDKNVQAYYTAHPDKARQCTHLRIGAGRLGTGSIAAMMGASVKFALLGVDRSLDRAEECLKESAIAYANDKDKIIVGMVGTKIFGHNEKGFYTLLKTWDEADATREYNTQVKAMSENAVEIVQLKTELAPFIKHALTFPTAKP